MVQKLKGVDASNILVGITGTFGSGKSSALKVLEDLGAFCLDADTFAKEAFLEESTVYQEIVSEFADAVSEEGCLDRNGVADIVFKDPARRRKLESIVHPYVFKRMAEKTTKALKKIVALEVPLLFETQFDRYCHFTIVVDVPESIIEARLQKKGYSQEDIRLRMNSQMDIKEKVKRASFVVNNSESLIETRQEIEEKVWSKLQPLLKGDS